MGMKRMAAQKTGNPVLAPPSISAADSGVSRLQSKKITEDKTRARALARAQAVAEKPFGALRPRRRPLPR